MIGSVASGVRAALLADTTISAAVGVRIYLAQAAEQADFPYVLMDVVGGGDSNATQRDDFDLTLQVKVVSTDGAAGTSASLLPGAQALALADAVRAALHNGAITLGSPWQLVNIEHEAPFYFVENDERRQYYHAGGTYRVRGSKS